MSPLKPSFCCTFATAERSTFARSRAIVLRVNCSVASAWLTFLPRISSHTSPAFWAEVRTPRAVACASIIVSSLSPRRSCLRLRRRAGSRRRGSRGRLLGLRGVPLERARRRELAELVAHHVLGHVDRDELLAVVHGHRVADHLGHHRRAARPGLDDLLLVRAVHRLELLEERRVDEPPLLQCTTHFGLLCTMNLSVFFRRRVL